MKRKAPVKSSSIKKKISKTNKTATSQPIRAPSTTSIPILDLVNDDDLAILEDNVAIDKDSLPSPQYTVSYTVKLGEKTVEEDSKVYQLDEGIKSFIWEIWDLQQALAVKKFCDNRGYSYHRHSVKAIINYQGPRRDPGTLVILRGASDWTRVKDHIRLWESLKKKGITVTIRVNWG